MENKGLNGRFWAELSFAGFIVFGSVFLFLYAMDLPTVSALLPFAMLACLIVFGSVLAITHYRRRAEPRQEANTVAPLSALKAFATIVCYTLAVQFLGFYVSTILMIPLVARAFGYRDAKGLALATALFVGGIYLIFSLLMGQQFPETIFLR